MNAGTMTALAREFPQLKTLPGVDPWDARKFDRASFDMKGGTAFQEAALFVLNVWNDEIEWQLGRFNLMRALREWGPQEREAFFQFTLKHAWPGPGHVVPAPAQTGSIYDRFSDLIRSFPDLADHPAIAEPIDDFDAEKLDAIARDFEEGSSHRYAAQFVLHVWDPSRAWSCGRFSLAAAAMVWDARNKLALQRWLDRPFRS